MQQPKHRGSLLGTGGPYETQGSLPDIGVLTKHRGSLPDTVGSYQTWGSLPNTGGSYPTQGLLTKRKGSYRTQGSSAGQPSCSWLLVAGAWGCVLDQDKKSVPGKDEDRIAGQWTDWV